MKQPIIVSYGMGKNSTALLIECVKRGIMVDLILSADTGGEKQETYDYRDMFNCWLKSQGFPEIVIVKKVDKDGKIMTLEQNCLENQMLPALAYGYKKCSLKFKVEPQDKYVNNWAPTKECWKAGQKVVKFIGYHWDEWERAEGHDEDKKYIYRYPLIVWEMGQADCIESIKSVGLPIPPKSSCFYCPSMRKPEIIDLKIKHPELLERALKIEKNAEPNLISVKGLGREWSWNKFIESGVGVMDDMFPDTYTGTPCSCYDG